MIDDKEDGDIPFINVEGSLHDNPDKVDEIVNALVNGESTNETVHSNPADDFPPVEEPTDLPPEPPKKPVHEVINGLLAEAFDLFKGKDEDMDPDCRDGITKLLSACNLYAEVVRRQNDAIQGMLKERVDMITYINNTTSLSKKEKGRVLQLVQPNSSGLIIRPN